MIIRLLGQSSEINIKCDKAFLSHITNSLSIWFESDVLARDTETLLKHKNVKTKHNESEITILNISDYDITIMN